ncbi:MAG TPA: serine/threonine-protein kinase [Bryobacteraceae bacterium]|nr:serine/threonine-protein kinase [Bryobacteraceae bacterium]
MGYEIGDCVGDYEVVGRLGAGGMGMVYKVRNVLTDRVEAMKILLPDLREAGDLAERFAREIKVHASLTHPNIASLHTAARAGGQLLMIMELVEGMSLRERLNQGPMDLRESVFISSEVLAALSYAHARGIIHRDIKPSNIMITPDRQVKVMDFGIAAVKGSNQRLTMTGMALGSLHYLSPEQVTSSPPDARSDVYSVGATLYEMVTGQCPFRGDSEYAILTAHLHQIPSPPAEVNPLVPQVLSTIILRALEKRPAERFQTAAEFRVQLEALLGKATGNVAAHVSGERTPPPPREGGSGSVAPGWDARDLQAAAQELAAYIGPLAKIIVNRATKRAHNLRELYEVVAAEIPSAADRAKFLANKL